MKEFTSSALPWIMMGIALAILSVNFAIESKRKKISGTNIALGASFGLLTGVSLNSCGAWDSHILGIVLGLVWGFALGSLFPDKEDKEDDTDSKTPQNNKLNKK
ncbi:MAG: hypothetical protein ACI4IF_07610 [Acutalibacteraceae bacterium]